MATPLLLLACSSPSHPAGPAPTSTRTAGTSPSPDPTDPRAALAAYLSDAADAEESWITDHDQYTAAVEDLVRAGLHERPGYSVTATAYGSDSYCLVSKAPDGTVRSYVSALDEEHYDGYLYDGDVCTPHASGRPFPTPSPSPSPSPTGRDAVDAALTGAADAEETLFTDASAFSADLAVLSARGGYSPVPGVVVTAHLVGSDGYCIDAAGLGFTRHYDSEDPEPSDGMCPAG